MAPQDSFIDEDEDTWYVATVLINCWLNESPFVEWDIHCNGHFADQISLARFVWKNSIYRIRTFSHVLVATR